MRFLISPNQWALFLLLGLRVGRLTALDRPAFNSLDQWDFWSLPTNQICSRSESWPADSFIPSSFQLFRPMSFLISPNQWALFLFLGLRVWPAGSSRRYSFRLSRPLSFFISPNQWALFLFLGLRVGRLTASDRPDLTLSTNEISDFSQPMRLFPFPGSNSLPADSFRPSSFQLFRPMSFLISPNQWALFLFLGLRVGRLTASGRPAFNPRDQWASSPPSRLCRHWRSRPNPSSSGQLSSD